MTKAKRIRLPHRVLFGVLFGTLLPPAAFGGLPPNTLLPGGSRPLAWIVADNGEESAACLIGEHPGISDSDARTTARILCDELRARKVAVGQPVTAADSATIAYRSTLERLGTSLILTFAYESPVGRTVKSERIQLRGIEEVPTVAPRLAEALVTGKSLAKTEEVGELVGEETDTFKQKSGHALKGMGLGVITVPGTGVVGAPAIDAHWFYETPDFGLGTNFRFGGIPGDNALLYLNWSLGGRYFFTRRNITPFVGGGMFGHLLTVKSADLRSNDDKFSDTTAGIGAYLAGGIEFLRLYEAHLTLEVRVDLPFGKLEDEGESHYAVPISLFLGVSF
ncbi:MAG: hypothetical protein D6795_18575 [Deltaproteobacteria bacterium]|nr:MAG: hypothetical protein D6795_18575 [Deltaproteobacteria bacterium]